MNHCDPADNSEANLETVHLAKKYLGKGVCAMDMAGYDEQMSNFAIEASFADEEIKKKLLAVQQV